MSDIIIKHLDTQEEILDAFPVMKQLRTHLDQESYIELVQEAREKEGYNLVGLYDAGNLVAVTGFMPMITLYNGHFIWVCDLVTDSSARSSGYGEKILSYVHEWAEEQGYPIVSLSSGLQRADAHRFYEEKMDYGKTSYVFLKRLGNKK